MKLRKSIAADGHVEVDITITPEPTEQERQLILKRLPTFDAINSALLTNGTVSREVWIDGFTAKIHAYFHTYVDWHNAAHWDDAKDMNAPKDEPKTWELDSRQIERNFKITQYELDLILEDHRQCILAQQAEAIALETYSTSFYLRAVHAEERLRELSPERHAAFGQELKLLRAEWRKADERWPSFVGSRIGWDIINSDCDLEKEIEVEKCIMYQMPEEALNHHGNIYDLIEAFGTTEPMVDEV